MRPSLAPTMIENGSGAFAASVVAKPSEKVVIAAAHTARHAGPTIGQAGRFSSQQPLAAPLAAQIGAAAADPVTAIANSSAARMERNSGTKGVRSRFREGYGAIDVARRIRLLCIRNFRCPILLCRDSVAPMMHCHHTLPTAAPTAMTISFQCEVGQFSGLFHRGVALC